MFAVRCDVDRDGLTSDSGVRTTRLLSPGVSMVRRVLFYLQSRQIVSLRFNASSSGSADCCPAMLFGSNCPEPFAVRDLTGCVA